MLKLPTLSAGSTAAFTPLQKLIAVYEMHYDHALWLAIQCVNACFVLCHIFCSILQGWFWILFKVNWNVPELSQILTNTSDL